MPTILGANTLSTGYNVANSLRFNDDDSAFLSKTFSGDGTHHDKGTVSVWLKRGELGAEQGIFTAGSSNRHFIRFESSDTLTFRAVTDSFHVQTTQVFRDPSAWYHIVIAYDTSQGTASDRVKMYVNGSQISSFSQTDYPDQDLDIKLGAAELNCIGKDSEQTNPYYDGYMAEFVYIDGQQLAPTSFGEFDEDSPTIWKPIDVSGLTFGTNGFHLDFEDSGTLGNDKSGNDNDFASSGLAATDQSTDTCTNNFCTMNPLNRYQYNFTFSEGNLKVANSSSNWHAASGTIGINTGKWYFEAKYTGSSNLQHWYVGFGGEAQNASDATRNSVAFYNNDGGEVHTSDVSNNTATTADYGTFSQNDIIGIALDYDNEYISVYKNGSAIVTNYDYGATSYSSNLKDGETIFPYVAHYASGDISMNFGSPAYSISSGNADARGHGNFEYSVPSGYFALCSKNLAEFG